MLYQSGSTQVIAVLIHVDHRGRNRLYGTTVDPPPFDRPHLPSRHLYYAAIKHLIHLVWLYFKNMMKGK